MKSHFTSDFFSLNRKKLRDSLTRPYPILCVGNGLLQRTADASYPFQQESNFWYLTGLSIPDLGLLIEANGTEYLLVPNISETKAVFDGALDTRMLQEISGIDTIISLSEGIKLAGEQAALHAHVYTIPPEKKYLSDEGMYTNPAAQRIVSSLRRGHPSIVIEDITTALSDLRVIKQPQELDAMRHAIDITTTTFDALRDSKTLKHIGTEFGVEAAFTNHFRSTGIANHAYQPIVASGSRATTLHYIENSQVIDPHDLTVIDIGAEVEHYAADITRTVSMSKPSARQQAVIDEVTGVQTRALALLKPGAMLRDYEETVVAYMGEALVRLKLIDNTKDIYQIRHYYPHATSHFLGLDVHDVGNYDAPLAENMVLTCEPGIYIPEEGIGVRIEDDILITSSGNSNLSDNCSHSAYVLL